MPNSSSKSPRSSRPIRDAELTQRAILEAAEEEFAKHGLQGARTDAIAAKTGVTKAMIYYYFNGKEALYKTVLDRCFQDYVRVWQQLQLDQLPPDVALERFIRRSIEVQAKSPHLSYILFHEAIQNQGKYYRNISGNQFYEVLTRILKRGMADKLFRDLSPEHTAINIVGTCVFYFIAHENIKHLWTGESMMSQASIQKHIQEVTDLVLAGVRR